MKKLCFFLFLFAFPLFAAAQSEFAVQVVAPSAFLRAAPSRDAEAIASVFENASFVAVGRNVDGEWFQISHPANRARTGWIARHLLSYTFEIAQLPITDLTTGVTGEVPVVDTGISVLMTGEVILRSEPDSDSAALLTLPPLVVIPVMERLPDNTWLKVNYRGTAGWVAEYLTRTSASLDDVPISPQYAPVYNSRQDASLEIIPLEIQIAQIDRLLAYIGPMKESARQVATFWQGLTEGKTMECRPPADYAAYVITPRDRVELPELRRQERLLASAIVYLNKSIAAMRRCGVYTPDEISAAYSDAVNARGQFAAVEQNMENLREYLLE